LRCISAGHTTQDGGCSASLVRFVDDLQHTRVAAARLEIADRSVASWEMALREGQDLLALRYRYFYGFGVDAGMACFVDAQECPRLVDVWQDLDGLVEERFVTVDAGAMVAWSSGWGDGSYPTWIGRDREGQSCASSPTCGCSTEAIKARNTTMKTSDGRYTLSLAAP
jgi:Protein of unknown function (DUF4241)